MMLLYWQLANYKGLLYWQVLTVILRMLVFKKVLF